MASKAPKYGTSTDGFNRKKIRDDLKEIYSRGSKCSDCKGTGKKYGWDNYNDCRNCSGYGRILNLAQKKELAAIEARTKAEAEKAALVKQIAELKAKISVETDRADRGVPSNKTRPKSPTEGELWKDATSGQHYEYKGGTWRAVARVAIAPPCGEPEESSPKGSCQARKGTSGG
jgi:RecJ-like exonuclease